MQTVRDLVVRLATARRTRPALTWYGTDGERVELSERVLATWAVKVANLLVEEADAGPGVQVVLDLPPHWRALVWALGAWTTGAEVALMDGAGSPPRLDGAVVVTHRPDGLVACGGGSGTPDLVVAVALPALMLRHPGGVPPGALDGTADLMAAPDALGWVPPLDLAAPALAGGPTHGELLAWAQVADAPQSGAESPPAGSRIMTGTEEGVARVLAKALAALGSGGSVVLVGDPGLDGGMVARTEGAARA